MESSAVWASDKGSCSEAPKGAAGQNPVELGTGGTPVIEEEQLSCSQTSENLEGMTEKFGTLGLRLVRKNRWSVARKTARKAKLAEAPTGASDGGQPQPTSGDQMQNLQKHSTCAAYHVQSNRNSQRVRGTTKAHKRQRSSGGTPGGG